MNRINVRDSNGIRFALFPHGILNTGIVSVDERQKIGNIYING